MMDAGEVAFYERKFKTTIEDYRRQKVQEYRIAHVVSRYRRMSYRAKFYDRDIQRTQQLIEEGVQLGSILSRNMCETMQAKLPRELRDMVYEFLWKNLNASPVVRIEKSAFTCCCVPSTHHNNVDSEKSSSSAISCGKSDNCTPTYYQPDKEFLNAKYFDEESLREMAETWYSTRMFDLKSSDLLEPLFSSDVWHLNLLPRNHIRTLVLRPKGKDRLEYTSDSQKISPKQSEGQSSSAKNTRDPLEPLKPLSMLKPGTDVYIALSASEDIVELALDTLKRLERSGLRILVMPLYAHNLGWHRTRAQKRMTSREIWMIISHLRRSVLPLLADGVPSLETWNEVMEIIAREKTTSLPPENALPELKEMSRMWADLML